MGQVRKEATHLGEIVILAPEAFGMSAGFSWRLTAPTSSRRWVCLRPMFKTTTRDRRKMSCVGCTFNMTHRWEANASNCWPRVSRGG